MTSLPSWMASGSDRVDVYGDSYGTYLAQVFALRHPDRSGRWCSTVPTTTDSIRSLGTPPRRWHDRGPRCAGGRGRVPTSSMTSARWPSSSPMEPLVGVGRRRGRPTGNTCGHRRRLRAAAVRRRLHVHDLSRRPCGYRCAAIGRCGALPATRRGRSGLAGRRSGTPASYSEGAYAAVACHDYPTIWDRSGTPEERRAQLDEAIAALARRRVRAVPERGMAGVGLRIPTRVRLPRLAGTRSRSRRSARADGVPHPDLPVLVLNGEFDITTPVANARTAARHGPTPPSCEVANEIHITALYDVEGCASRIVRRFIRTLDAGDTSCARRTPQIHVVDTFPGSRRGSRSHSRAGRRLHGRGSTDGVGRRRDGGGRVHSLVERDVSGRGRVARRFVLDPRPVLQPYTALGRDVPRRSFRRRCGDRWTRHVAASIGFAPGHTAGPRARR